MIYGHRLVSTQLFSHFGGFQYCLSHQLFTQLSMPWEYLNTLAKNIILASRWRYFETTDQFTFIVFLHHDDILARFYFSLVSTDHTFPLIFDHFPELIKYFDTIDSNEASVVLCVKQAQLIHWQICTYEMDRSFTFGTFDFPITITVNTAAFGT